MTTVAATNPTVDELEKKEEELFRTGPLSVLTTSVKSNSQVGAHARSSNAVVIDGMRGLELYSSHGSGLC
jgi:hypothetical protein